MSRLMRSWQALVKEPFMTWALFWRLLWVKKKVGSLSLPVLIEQIKARRSRRRFDNEMLFHYCVRMDQRLFGRPSCLRSALVLFWLMDDCVKLKIGAHAGEQFEAHAWVEAGERVFNTEEREHYAEILEFTK